MSNAIADAPLSHNPFAANPAIAPRVAALTASVGSAVAADLEEALTGRHGTADNSGAVILAEEVGKIVARHGLAGPEELMLLALTTAQTLARPPISAFFVGAVGLERNSGNLILGGNLEFPGTHLATTVHGEGFVFTRAASRGAEIAVLAIGEAHPCAHCRQYLSEFAATAELVLIDPLGHRLTMAQLYPWPFDPDYLGEPGYRPGAERAAPALAANTLPPAIAARLVAAGCAAHAPYSKCPGAVVLALRDGELVAGFSIESVAFNPTMSPLQAALIDLYAHGYEPSDIVSAHLATRRAGAVDHVASTAELLGSVAIGVGLDVVEWA